MDYATDYDVGEKKRDGGINEDSVALVVFEDGHRMGLAPGAGPATEASVESPEEGSGEGPGEGLGESPVGSEEARDGTERDDGAGDVSSNGAETAADGDQEPAADASEGSPSVPEPDGEPGSGVRNRSAVAFALADGAGGHDAGDVASYLASTVVCERLAEIAIRSARSDPEPFGVDVGETLPSAPTTEEIHEAIADAVDYAHQAVLDYAAEAGQAAYTTVVAGIAVGGELHYGWVGDSRAYLCNRQHGSIERLTADHAVVTQLEEAGEIDDVEAMVHPRGNEITRALGGAHATGGEAHVEVDTNTVDLYGDDVVLVTSDGLIDAQTDAPDLFDDYVAADRSEAAAETVRDAVVTDAEIRDVVLEAESLSGAAGDLVTLANERGGKDNVSTLLFGDTTLPAAPSTAPDRGVEGPPPVESRDTVVLKEE